MQMKNYCSRNHLPIQEKARPTWKNKSQWPIVESFHLSTMTTTYGHQFVLYNNNRKDTTPPKCGLEGGVH
jgi:hypothetical protein